MGIRCATAPAGLLVGFDGHALPSGEAIWMGILPNSLEE